MGSEHDASQLVAEAVAGNSEAFARLLAPYRTRLFGYLMRACGQRQLAEDLLQETLLRCWRALPDYRHRGRFAAWLFTIARNTQRDQARRPEAGVQGAEHLHRQAAAGLDPHHRFELRQLGERVQRVVDGLPAGQRDVFLLRHYGEMSFREIAELRGQPLGTVLSHMHRAVKAIKETIDAHARR